MANFTTRPLQAANTIHVAAIANEEVKKQLGGEAANITVVITANKAMPRLDYSDLQSALVTDVTEQADRTVRTFFEVLTSQYLVNS